MSEEIEIPAVAYEPKPWWPQRPADDLIKEITSFIYRTSQPHLWAGQTYNRPPDDIPIDYLAEFHLPSSKPLVPCPCCTPTHGKYRHGMVAHFPTEGTIRIMGHACFNNINSVAHNEALKKFRVDAQRKSDIAYLIANLDKVPNLINAVEGAVPIGHAIDDFRNRSCVVFKEVLRLDLWEHIRTGHLTITAVRKQLIKSSNGEEERDVQITEPYGSIRGQDFLKLRSPKIGLKLDNVLLALRQINFGADFKVRTAEMTDEHRQETARLLARAIRSANDAFTSIQELRQFTSAATIATLNGWARIKECPIHMKIEYDGSSLLLGKRDFEARRIEVPQAYLLTLPVLPKINLKSVAA